MVGERRADGALADAEEDDPDVGDDESAPALAAVRRVNGTQDAGGEKVGVAAAEPAGEVVRLSKPRMAVTEYRVIDRAASIGASSCSNKEGTENS
jgi:hypothetical protein